MKPPTKAIICEKLVKNFTRLTATENSSVPYLTGYLYGWEAEDSIICLGTARSNETVDFPAGLTIIGCFYLPLHGSMSEEDMINECEQNIDNSLEDSSTQNQYAIILKVAKNVGGDKKITVDLSAQILSLDSRLTSPVTVIVKDNDSIMENVVFINAKGTLPINFEAHKDKEALESNLMSLLERYQLMFNSNLAAFSLENSSLLLRTIDREAQEMELKCEDLYGFIEEEDDGFGMKSKSKKKTQKWNEKEPLRFRIFLQTTGDAALLGGSGYTPVIHYQRRNFKSVSMSLPIDVIAMVSSKESSHRALQILTHAICVQLAKMMKCIVRFAENELYFVPEPYHFWPSLCGHLVTIIYPLGLTEEYLASYKTVIHRTLMLPEDRPFFRKACQFAFPSDEPADKYLRNTHVGLPPSGVQDGITAIVDGTYTYHHYMQDRIDDNGWGCAYRSLQTIVSWFRHQGYTEKSIPTHREIQQALVEVGDKPGSFVGSKQWIGSQEISICLNHLFGITSKIMFVNSGSELANKGRELVNHFLTQGTPIMIGGGLLAHTILGVDFSEKTGELKFLVLDPHYTGAEDLHVIQNKGWCGWKGVGFWDQTAFYNLCLPQRPVMI